MELLWAQKTHLLVVLVHMSPEGGQVASAIFLGFVLVVLLPSSVPKHRSSHLAKAHTWHRTLAIIKSAIHYNSLPVCQRLDKRFIYVLSNKDKNLWALLTRRISQCCFLNQLQRQLFSWLLRYFSRSHTDTHTLLERHKKAHSRFSGQKALCVCVSVVSPSRFSFFPVVINPRVEFIFHTQGSWPLDHQRLFITTCVRARVCLRDCVRKQLSF